MTILEKESLLSKPNISEIAHSRTRGFFIRDKEYFTVIQEHLQVWLQV